jgi:hypothetical protein
MGGGDTAVRYRRSPSFAARSVARQRPRRRAILALVEPAQPVEGTKEVVGGVGEVDGSYTSCQNLSRRSALRRDSEHLDKFCQAICFGRRQVMRNVS